MFLNNILIHIHTVTLTHTWELQSTNAVCCRKASEGKLEEGRPRSESQVQITETDGGFNPALSPPCLWVAGVKMQLVVRDDALHRGHRSIHQLYFAKQNLKENKLTKFCIYALKCIKSSKMAEHFHRYATYF